MTTATQEKAVKEKVTLENLSPDTVTGAERAEKAFTFTKGASQAASNPDIAMELMAEKGVTKEAYIQVKEAEAHAHRTLGLGFGRAAIHHLAANPELTHVTSDVPTVGKDKIALGLKRVTPYSIRDGEGAITGTGTSYGTLTVDHKSYSTKKRGEMSKISSLLNDLAEAQLKSN